MQLATQVAAHGPDLVAAARAYDERRRAALAPRQASARESMTWFEGVPSVLDDAVQDGSGNADAVDFSYALRSRRGPTRRGAVRENRRARS